MKYSTQNPPLVCMMTNSTCYKGTTTMQIKGVLWHSTGANNPTIKRYVQPSDNDPNRDELLRIIGVNKNHNDWNHIYRAAGLNCWVGKLADGTVSTVQTMPWNYKPWGCGSGSKGSCNNGWIQFEICEDALTDKNYFEAAYKEACEITAYLCMLCNINPQGTVQYNGVTVPTILCHQDSYRLGLGSNHSDVYNWFNRYGKTMQDVRNDVQTILAGVTPTPVTTLTTTYSVYDKVKKKWLPNVTGYNQYDNNNGYAGNIGNDVTGIMVKVDNDNIEYDVGTIGGNWLSAVTGFDKSDKKNGYAGKTDLNTSAAIDRFMIKSKSGNAMTYCVNVKKDGKNIWLPEVTGYDKNDSKNGYAGMKGYPITAIMVRTEKKVYEEKPEEPKPTTPPVEEPKPQEPPVVTEPTPSNPTPTEPEIIPGDINGDGKITEEDLQLLKEYLANYDDETGKSTVTIYKENADLNGDGEINNKDVVVLKKLLQAEKEAEEGLDNVFVRVVKALWNTIKNAFNK